MLNVFTFVIVMVVEVYENVFFTTVPPDVLVAYTCVPSDVIISSSKIPLTFL